MCQLKFHIRRVELGTYPPTFVWGVYHSRNSHTPYALARGLEKVALYMRRAELGLPPHSILKRGFVENNVLVRGANGRIEYRPKLNVFDAVCPGHGYSTKAMMAGARKLRTNDFFEAIGFLLRGGVPSKEEA